RESPPVDAGPGDEAGTQAGGAPPSEPPPVPAATAPAPARMLRNNLFVASGTAVSRLTGLIRSSLIFVLLVEGLGDAYLGANNTPNMIYELILGGVLTATLVPLFTDDLEHGGKDGATSAIISFALVALAVVTVLAAVVAPLIVVLLGTGSSAGSRHDYLAAAVPLSLLFAPQVFFYGLMAVWSAVLNSRHRFLAAAWAPVLNNVIAIATLLAVWQIVDGYPTIGDALADKTILVVLGIGTTAGIATMALALYPSVRRAGVRLRFKLDLKHPAVRRTLRLSGWTFGYVAVNMIAVLVVGILSKPGSDGTKEYQTAYQFFQLPHGLLAVSIMVTFEPLLGRADARGDRRDFNRQLLLGFRLIGLLMIPAAVGYVALPKGLDHRTFVATGQLGQALDLTSIIAAFAVGLPGFSTYLYALRGFYAMKNTRTPFFINCFENAVNIVAAVVFVRLWGIAGLALSFALAYTLAAVVAVVALTRASPGFDWRGLLRTWLQLLVSAGMMGCVVFGLLVVVSPGSALTMIPTVVGATLGGIVVYFVVITVSRVDGIADLFARLPGLKRLAGASPPT
ncbi:MAG: Murein biosynthesis integral rane protein MurJ, partial [Acidimicrobiales bacterium]|nr:Murein biosynthesis integral rane protein MurJ [Acidimicrobiales bacterium]